MLSKTIYCHKNALKVLKVTVPNAEQLLSIINYELLYIISLDLYYSCINVKAEVYCCSCLLKKSMQTDYLKKN